jgi:hypothetical protein
MSSRSLKSRAVAMAAEATQSSAFKFGNERAEATLRLQKELLDRCVTQLWVSPKTLATMLGSLATLLGLKPGAVGLQCRTLCPTAHGLSQRGGTAHTTKWA